MRRNVAPGQDTQPRAVRGQKAHRGLRVCLGRQGKTGPGQGSAGPIAHLGLGRLCCQCDQEAALFFNSWGQAQAGTRP
jgi:hypothetical protein